MNKLIEMINYSSDSYWGDKERFKFNARIDSYSNTTDVVQGDNRVVKTNFGLTLQGYLVPDSINKELTKKPQKFSSKSTVIFNSELSVVPSGVPMTREQIREKTEDANYGTLNIKQNIKQNIRGVSYQVVGTNNEIG